MKTLAVWLAGALALGCAVLTLRLTDAAKTTAAARAEIASLQQRQGELQADAQNARRQAGAADAKARLLEQQLADERQARKELAAKLAAASVSTPPAEAAPAEGPFSPGLLAGSYTEVDGTRLYSADAQLRIGENIVVSSPKGTMLSDLEQQIVGGDLALTTKAGVLKADDAFVEVNGDEISIDAKHLTLTTPAKDAAKPGN